MKTNPHVINNTEALLSAAERDACRALVELTCTQQGLPVTVTAPGVTRLVATRLREAHAAERRIRAVAG